jgi:cytochrome d ubiquinol oxidase subunit I
VATGVVMEFQFGMNWSYQPLCGRHLWCTAGDRGFDGFFGARRPLSACSFCWDAFKVKHLIVTCLMAIGTNFGAMDSGRQWLDAEPVLLQPQTMRMEVETTLPCFTNPVAQAKFCTRCRVMSWPRCSCWVFRPGICSRVRHIHLASAR